MTISFDAASSSGYEAALSTYNWTHTVGAGVVNGGLVVGVAIFVAGSVTSVTYGGKNLTFIRSDTNGVYRSELWYLQNPALGANSVVVTLNASLTSIAGAASYTFCGGPGAQAGANGTNTPASVSLTPIQDKSIVFANLSTQTASGVTDAGGQNNRWNSAGALGTNRASDIGPVTPPAVQTVTYNGIGAVDSWALSAVALVDLQHNPSIYRA